jgi:hypothetical protein
MTEEKKPITKKCDTCGHKKKAGVLKYAFIQPKFKCEKTGQPRMKSRANCPYWIEIT